MPMFYFDLTDGEDETPDLDGTRFTDRDAARDEAMGLLSDMARSELPDGNHRTFTVTVKGDDKAPIFSAELTVVGRWLDAGAG